MASYRFGEPVPTHIPGLEEKAPYWLSEGVPNCYACTDNYAVADGCNRCDRVTQKLLFDDDSLTVLAEGLDTEPPELKRSLDGGFFLSATKP